jgi:hypothetical protein
LQVVGQRASQTGVVLVVVCAQDLYVFAVQEEAPGGVKAEGADAEAVFYGVYGLGGFLGLPVVAVFTGFSGGGYHRYDPV